MTNAFHKTIWSEVRVGDTVLATWETLGSEIVAVKVEDRIKSPGPDGESLVFVYFHFDHTTYALSFDAEKTAYIQSRL